MSSHLRTNKNKAKEKAFFLKNGAAVLEQLIFYFNGDCNPIRTFSVGELITATNNFQKEIHWDSSYSMYKGIHEDREISVKMFKENSIYQDNHPEKIANEVAVASKMSNHKNVLKLLGCCLETELPILVYEFPEKGNLCRCMLSQQLSWKSKLRIAGEIANAVAYLHHGLPKVIIHRDIKLRNIFLDKNDIPKLSEFRIALPIPEGETHVDAEIFGTIWSVAPEAGNNGRYTEKCDVYSFGVMFCELLTGKRSFDLLHRASNFSERSSSLSEDESGCYWPGKNLCSCCTSYLEANLLGEENSAQVMECTKLFQSCLKESPHDRPNMIQVAQALRLINSINS